MSEVMCPKCDSVMRPIRPEELSAPPEFFERFDVSVCDREHEDGVLGHTLVSTKR